MPLYIVATPIGNMDDLTPRARDTLDKCSLILAEDTRRIGGLLKNAGIGKKELSSFHKHSQHKIKHVIDLLKEGKEIALVSDNGTPVVSDPGWELVRAVADSELEIVPVPGVSAVTTALMVSGFAADQFVFLGFFPKKQKEQKKIFEEILGSERTFVLYESPYRIKKTLQIFSKELPEVDLCVCREMTKKFESFYRGKAAEIIDSVKEKGEFCIVLKN